MQDNREIPDPKGEKIEGLAINSMASWDLPDVLAIERATFKDSDQWTEKEFRKYVGGGLKQTMSFSSHPNIITIIATKFDQGKYDKKLQKFKEIIDRQMRGELTKEYFDRQHMESFEKSMYDEWVKQELKKQSYKPIGFAICEGEEIVNIAVHPDFRGKGVGTLMVEDLKEKIKDDPKKSKLIIRIDERDLNAQKFFGTTGFKATRVLKKHGEDDKYLMECVLKERMQSR